MRVYVYERTCVSTNCYMAILQEYVCMYMCKNVHAYVQWYLRMYTYTSMYYAIGDRTYVHISTYMCKYVCMCMCKNVHA